MKLVLDRMSYDNDPDAFVSSCMEEQEALRKKLLAAQEMLPNVTMPRDLKVLYLLDASLTSMLYCLIPQPVGFVMN